MSNILTLTHIQLAYGLAPLLDDISFSMLKGERCCLIGRNGAGKSSLLKIIAQEIKPDSGTIWFNPSIQVARLEQSLPERADVTLFTYIAQGLEGLGNVLSEYHHLTHNMQHASQAQLKQLEILQHKIEVADGWQFEQRIKTVATRLDLPLDKKLNELSGGWLRRAALAKALVKQPDLLLLDEPTNHLDIKAITWLEEFLVNSQISLLFITHDRALLQRTATRILELDRGKLTSWPCSYAAFLERKEAMLASEAKLHADFDKKLAQEEVWIRQGIKARRTRNEGRVSALKAMRKERLARRAPDKAASFQINAALTSGQIVAELKDVSYRYHEQVLVDHFSFILQRGDRVGLVGENGIGKTTLLNILLGKLAPLSGKVKLGSQLAIAYFDQLRQQLAPEQTVREAIALGSDMLTINGKEQHVISYLQDFLFTPERANTPIKALSGGECNRLLLARLFAQPANLLVLDEPTNDLDIETLELLEDLLAHYKGTVLIVSHDRQFLDNVCTSYLLFKGNGVIEDYIGEMSHIYETLFTALKDEAAPTKVKEKNLAGKANRKLSYQAQRELDRLPALIERLENEILQLQENMAGDGFYQQAAPEIANTLDKLKQLEDELATAYARWDALEQMANS